ncbi:LLM class flavin-dependent oxidoreductase [Streptobacillus canis]|uniref:LLM class flavin-dependent oxidoreductase n=1 Tax=Streptobacillus canis TaxID=2678686 RepID=UPI0012E2F9AA|nr:LLM class flavin-dependent oxidoreductase [Streptobacillus canis]
MKIELGISTFGETTIIEQTGKAISHAERIRNLVEEIELADKVGLDVYGIGEHHRDDFAVSNPEIILAAGAVNTKNIKLTSAVTVLSSADPIRIYQNFATVDALSKGRAEIMVGRGSFIESFPLFGYNLADYDELFKEKLDMLLAIKENEILNWKGTTHTHKVDGKGVYPRAEKLDVWVGTGGNLESTVNIALQGLPVAYAILGGGISGFKGLINHYRNIGLRANHPIENLKVAAHSWGFIAKDKEEAIKKYYYPTKLVMDRIAEERAHWSKLTWDRYLNMVGDDDVMFVGDPETVANKLIRMIEELGLNRFLLHLPLGSLPHEDILESIRLFGEEVAPKVREYFKDK